MQWDFCCVYLHLEIFALINFVYFYQYDKYNTIQNLKIYPKSMSQKGLLKLIFRDIESTHFTKQSPYAIQLSSGSSDHKLLLQSKFLCKEQNQKHFDQEKAFYYPAVDVLNLKIQKPQSKLSKYGYFHLPLHKIYNFPQNQHHININCLWVEDNSQQSKDNILHPLNEKQIAAKIKISFEFLPSATSKLTFQILGIAIDKQNFCKNYKEILQNQSTQLSLVIHADDSILESEKHLLSLKRLQQEQHSFHRLQLQSRQKLTFQLEKLPVSFSFHLKIANNVAIGQASVNPFSGFTEWFKEGEARSTINLHSGKNRTSSIQLGTFYRVEQKPS